MPTTRELPSWSRGNYHLFAAWYHQEGSAIGSRLGQHFQAMTHHTLRQSQTRKMTPTVRKLRKLFRTPGLYWRDYFLKRYPLEGSRKTRSGTTTKHRSRRSSYVLAKAYEGPLLDECVTFGITLASSKSAANWDRTVALLQGTLRSVIQQSSPAWRVIIAGHEMPDVEEIEHPQVEFLSINAYRPTHPSKFRADKARKRHAIGQRLRELGGGFLMQLDADDLVASDLVAECLSRNHPHGYILTRGYVYDWQSRNLAPVPGVWPLDLDRVCGSCAVVRYDEEDLPSPETEVRDPDVVFNMTRQHAYIRVVCEELRRPLLPLERPMVVYVVNHGVSLSFQMQKRSSRGANIVESVEKHRIPQSAAEEALARFGIHSTMITAQ